MRPFVLVALIAMAACATPGKDTAIGGGAGAAGGALIGGLAGGWEGAAIGALAGGLVGGAIGNYLDNTTRSFRSIAPKPCATSSRAGGSSRSRCSWKAAARASRSETIRLLRGVR